MRLVLRGRGAGTSVLGDERYGPGPSRGGEADFSTALLTMMP
jgi:hypothetical protein